MQFSESDCKSLYDLFLKTAEEKHDNYQSLIFFKIILLFIFDVPCFTFFRKKQINNISLDDCIKFNLINVSLHN